MSCYVGLMGKVESPDALNKVVIRGMDGGGCAQYRTVQ